MVQSTRLFHSWVKKQAVIPVFGYARSGCYNVITSDRQQKYRWMGRTIGNEDFLITNLLPEYPNLHNRDNSPSNNPRLFCHICTDIADEPPLPLPPGEFSGKNNRQQGESNRKRRVITYHFNSSDELSKYLIKFLPFHYL